MIIRGDEVKMIHLSEIHTLLLDSTQVYISSFLMSELLKRKVKIIVCDEKRNPQGEILPYYGCHNTSKKVMTQICWNERYARLVWTDIIKQKIMNQANLLQKLELDSGDKLYGYIDQVEEFDSTNREGHAAKVYFNLLFGKDFSRDEVCNVNAALDYGYSILLSSFNKEIVSAGYLTQLGIKHINEYNQFNLTSDLMEPFRILVDECVYINQHEVFDTEYKMMLINLLNQKVMLKGREQYLTNAIPIYLKSVFQAIEEQDLSKINRFLFQ